MFIHQIKMVMAQNTTFAASSNIFYIKLFYRLLYGISHKHENFSSRFKTHLFFKYFAVFHSAFLRRDVTQF